ncbi:MAG TPA: CARDB domain-containing protein, partial [Poseidonia sp.]|nr:CARDB domain-containing protein [Poseidonia sp.]
GYSVEVPLSSATTLQSSPSRTCLISITNIPGRGEDMTGTLVSTTLQVIVDDAAPRVTRRITPLNVIDISASNDLTQIPVEFQGTEDADLTGSKQMVHWVMRDSTRTMTIGAGSTLLGMQQDGQTVTWTGILDITAGGTIVPKAGDFVGFYLTGYDAAGNQFPLVSNSEASPVPELAADDTDFERQWIRLGAVGPELRINNIAMSDDHIAPGSKIDITADVYNAGGNTTTKFMVTFYAGDNEKPFEAFAVNGMEGGETLSVKVQWDAEDVDRVRVVVDEANMIPEVNDDDNSAEHKVTIAYGEYFGWFDSVRENPLAWIFAFVSIITLVAVVTVASKTSIDYGEGVFDEEDWDDDEEQEDDYDDEDAADFD